MLEQLIFTMGGPLRAGSLRVEVAVRERKVYVGADQADSLEELPQFGVGIFPLPFFILIFNNLRYFLTVNPLSEIPPTPSFFLLY